MKEYNLSSPKGKQLYEKGCRYEGIFIENVYTKPSNAKVKAFERCFEEYIKTENYSVFSICSHNVFGFTCSWCGTLNGEHIMRYETKDNSYLIWLDR